MSDAQVADASRRTRLSAERTWLAWWRSGVAAATAALAVGGLVPELRRRGGLAVHRARVRLRLAAAAMFVGGALRKRAVDRSLEEGYDIPLPFPLAVALSAAGCALAVGTLLVIALA